MQSRVEALRKRKPRSGFLYGLGAAIALYTVYATQSRGGLVGAILVPGVYLFRRYGLKAVVPAGLIAVPVRMPGGPRRGAGGRLTAGGSGRGG